MRPRREQPRSADQQGTTRRGETGRGWRRRTLTALVALLVVSSGVVVAAAPAGALDDQHATDATTLAQVGELPDGGIPLPPGTTEHSVCGLSLEYGTVTLEATTGFFQGVPFLFADPLSQGLFLVANVLDFANLGDGLTGLTLDCEIFASEAAPEGGSFTFSLNDQESPAGFCAAVDGDPSSILCTQAEQERQLWVFTSTGELVPLLSTVLSGAPVTAQFYPDGLPAPALDEVDPTPAPVDTTVSFLYTNGELTAWDGLPLPTEELQPGENALDAPGTHVVVARDPGATEFTYYRVVDGDVLELPTLDGRVVRHDVPEPAPFLFFAEDTGTGVTGVDHRGNEFDESFGLPPLFLPPPGELANPNLQNVVCSQFSSPFPTSDLLVSDLSAADRAAVGVGDDTQTALLTLPATPSGEAPISWAVGGCNVRTFEDPLAALLGSTADGGGVGVDPRTPDGRAALGFDTVIYHAGVDGTDGERIHRTFDAELNEIELDQEAVTPEPPSGLSVELLPGTDDPIRYALAPIPLQIEIPIEGFAAAFWELETDDGFELGVDVGDEPDVLFTLDIGPPPRFFTPEAGADRGDDVDEQADYTLVSRVQTVDGRIGTVSVGTDAVVTIFGPGFQSFRYGLPPPTVDADPSEVPSGFTCTALHTQLPDGVSDEPSLFRPPSPPDTETSIVVFPAFDDAPGSLGVSVDYGVAPCPNEPQGPGGEPPATSIMTEMNNTLVIA